MKGKSDKPTLPKPVNAIEEAAYLVVFDKFTSYGFKDAKDATEYAEHECRKRMKNAYIFRMAGGFTVSVVPVPMPSPGSKYDYKAD